MTVPVQQIVTPDVDPSKGRAFQCLFAPTKYSANIADPNRGQELTSPAQLVGKSQVASCPSS